MILTKIILVGVFVAALLMLAQHERWIQRAGLVASCENVSPPAGQTEEGQWWQCREGVITGFVTLEGDGCSSRGYYAKRTELWLCPVPLERAPGY